MNKSSISRDEVLAALERLGQKKLKKHLEGLARPAQQELLEQLTALDFDALEKLLRGEEKTASSSTQVEPVEAYRFSKNAEKEIEIGEDFLSAGKVAVFAVAGGQGSRLGYEGPKGCFPVTPVRKAPLFQVFAERILAAECRYATTIPWVVMTSPQNNNRTVEFFWDNKFFGLKEEQIFFFNQGVMPAVDAKTQDFLLETPTSLALSPDGHGGAIKGLYRSGALEWLQRRNLETLSYFQIDNPFVKIVDAAFLGAHRLSGSQFSSKSLPKRSADEKVGNFVQQGGKMSVIEYSDMPKSLSEERDASGSLRFNQGSIAIHALEVGFIKQIAETSALPYHRASKKVPFLGEDGKLVSPTAPNATKFEQFIFDAIPLAKNPIVVETRREEEFSPVKNAEGADSPASCRADQLKLWASWLKAAGVGVPTDAAGVPTVNFEITPRFAQSAEEVKAKLPMGFVLKEGTVLT